MATAAAARAAAAMDEQLALFRFLFQVFSWVITRLIDQNLLAEVLTAAFSHGLLYHLPSESKPPSAAGR